ncbi:hypothetical protein [Xanthomonas sacchari]|uniref:hypothetical protein n=1 Tax=Xanthomonas sacchari TaxID=56458 RepID=UPI003528BED1
MAQEQQQMLGFDPLPKKTRKEIFLEEMNRVVPWAALVAANAAGRESVHASTKS